MLRRGRGIDRLKLGGDEAGSGELTLSQAELIDRIGWLIQLRWLAFAGVAGTVVIARAFFESALPWVLLLITSLAIPAYNIVCYLAWRRARQAGRSVERVSWWLANAQIVCDLLVLGALIHLSGGMENPFGFYFVFHMVIAGILLSPRAAFAQATLAVVIFLTIVVGEYAGFLPHYQSPAGMRTQGLHSNGTAVFAASWVMVTSLYVTTYLTTAIATHLKWREDQIVLLSRNLRRRSDELQEAYDRLAAIERAKSAYTRQVAHELRSPLAAIDNLLRVVADGLQGEIPPQVAETVAQARRRTRALLAVVKDLLLLAAAREAGGQREMGSVDLKETLEAVVTLLAPDAESRGVVLDTHLAPDLPQIGGDSEGLETLFTNLVANAVKYSPEGGKVDIRATANRADVEIRVADSGIGIDKADQERIFDEFYRTPDARSHTADGTGLGLAIAKSVVDAHGGTIAVESEKGKGATFIVRLPAGRRKPDGVAPARPSP